MVSPVLFDTILDPSKELRELFVDQDHNGFGAIVERHFKQILLPHEAFYQVPGLTCHCYSHTHLEGRFLH